MNGLIDKVVQWANEKGILENGTLAGQALKTVEEAFELVKAKHENNPAEMSDARGDVMVTLIILSEMLDYDLKGFIKSTDPLVTPDHNISEISVLATACTLYHTLSERGVESVPHLIRTLVEKLLWLGNLQYDLQGAYDVISTRTGTMLNGIFVKDGK